MFADRTGRVWVEDYRIGDEPTATWTVFAPDGDVSFRVDLPPELTLMDAGPDALIGVRTDAYDVETVVVVPMVN